MTEADILFQKEGYRKDFHNDIRLIYVKKKAVYNSQFIFNLTDKSIEIGRFDKSGRHHNKIVPAGQLKAMLKKMEELGWEI